MAVVIDHGDAVNIAHMGKAAADALKARKRLGCGIDVETQDMGNG